LHLSCLFLRAAVLQPFHFNVPFTVAYAASSDAVSNRVDLYNRATGTWSTAQLGTATYHLAATSVGNVALFASGAVDVYDSATGAWSTALLSVARSRLAATSVGNMALFAGGEIVWQGTSSRCVSFVECSCLRLCRLLFFACSSIAAVFFPRDLTLSFAASAGAISNRVDLYNSATGTWSTAQLSVARFELAATTVGNTAMFAGGWTQNQGRRC
jgi:hypothetical protein